MSRADRSLYAFLGTGDGIRTLTFGVEIDLAGVVRGSTSAGLATSDPDPSRTHAHEPRSRSPRRCPARAEMIGLPLAGEKMLLVDSISTRASVWASIDSGRWTAIWSPSKSALKATQTSG